MSDQLLAPLAVDLFVHLRDERRIEVERIRSGLGALVDALATAGETSRRRNE